MLILRIMNRDPIESLRGLITDLNFQIKQLKDRITQLEERDQTPDEITCRKLVIADDDDTERVIIEVDEDDDATIRFFDADGTPRVIAGAFSDGEAYAHLADSDGDAVVVARCTSDGEGTLDASKAD